jgi:AraC-like DNA-binding protein
MLKAPLTIPIAFVHGLLSGVVARGLPAGSYLADAGIAPDLLEHAGARVTFAQYIALIRSVIDRLDDEALGFLSRPIKRGSLALIARSALNAASLDSAMHRISRAVHLLQDDMTLEIVRDGPLAGMALRFPTAALQQQRFFHEYMLRMFWRLLAWLAGGALKAVRFDFAFELPPYAGSYGAAFPAPLQFGQAVSAFWFDADNLSRPVLRDEGALKEFVASWPADLLLPRRPGDMTSARVRGHLRQSRPAWPSLEETAGALHMAASTLQRRLAGEGTSFQALKDELRRDLAIVRLSSSDVSLGTLAGELGFADTAAFQRAFKGWTGSAPGAYRRGAPG